VSAVTVHSPGWTAKVLESENPSPDGMRHIYATIDGDSAALALFGAEHILNVYAKGRVAFIRVMPEVGVDRRFDSQIVRYLGFVRFSYRLEPGEWTYVESSNVAQAFEELK
jgi:hypothetical protein